MHIISAYTTVFGGFTTIRPKSVRMFCILSMNLNLKFYVMEKYTEKHPILNSILTVLNVSLEVILALIALGFIIGLYGILN